MKEKKDKKLFDYLVVGAGLYGAVFAHEAVLRGKKVLVIDRRQHIGGNCRTEKVAGINVHKYGAHIFRTSCKDVWDYIRKFAEFNHFVNSPIAKFRDKIYNLPFNMNTFNRIWGVTTPAEAKAIIEEQRKEVKCEPRNLEEKAISLVGRDVYEILVKEYSEKQWGRPCRELPPSTIRRLPVRFTYDNNYFNDPYQGIPKGGYTSIFDKLLEGCEVRTGVGYEENRGELERIAGKIVYTGAIDEYFGYCAGQLEYRSLRFDHKLMEGTCNYQGVAVVNHIDASTPCTRTIEHKHFEFGTQPDTVVTFEYSCEWEKGMEPFYPVNDERNQRLYARYAALAAALDGVRFGGRLGSYCYTDMQDTIIAARKAAEKEFA